MNEIHNSKLNEIKSVFDDLDQNRNAHDVITRLQSGTHSQLEFTRPVIQKDTVAWISREDLALKNYENLEASQQLEVLAILQKEMEVFRQKFKASAGSDATNWCDKVLEIPHKKSIYVGLQGHEMRVVLTEWGFHENVFQPDKGVIKKLIEKSDVSLVIKVVSEAGKPQENHQVMISGPEGDQEHSTNSEGIVGLPSIPSGERLNIASGQHPQVSEVYESKPFGLVTLVVPEEEEEVAGKIEEEEDEVARKIEEDEEEVAVITEEVKEGISLLNNNNKPIKNHKIFISEVDDGKESSKPYVSDKAGLLKDFKMDPNKSYKVKTRYRLSKWEGTIDHGSLSNFSAIKVPFVFPWLWTLLGIFLIVIWFIPLVPVGHKYVVMDADGDRVEDVKVESYLTGRDTKLMHENKTDSEGEASFNLGRVSLFRYIIWPKDVIGKADSATVKSTKAPFVSPVDTICVGNR